MRRSSIDTQYAPCWQEPSVIRPRALAFPGQWLRLRGQPPSRVINGTPRARVMDLLIAATAHAHGARLVTHNAQDLVGLEGLIDIVSA